MGTFTLRILNIFLVRSYDIFMSDSNHRYYILKWPSWIDYKKLIPIYDNSVGTYNPKQFKGQVIPNDIFQNLLIYLLINYCYLYLLFLITSYYYIFKQKHSLYERIIIINDVIL
jgi:hypothetical protein